MSAVNEQFERQQDAERFFGKKQSTHVLRNAADFERHYESRSTTNEDPFDIADYLRGVANLRTSAGVQNALY